MSKKPLGIQSLWELAAAVMAVLLYLDFLVIALLGAAAIGVLFLDPVPVVFTGLLLLLGILCHLMTRRRTGKLWRRLLLGGIAADFLVVAFYVLTAVVMVMAWQ
ncbi:MAG: hypothetical protein K2P33_03530 [Acutalibacter sp.]|nr:hypothetical protein [Acutalibacter sp.]